MADAIDALMADVIYSVLGLLGAEEGMRGAFVRWCLNPSGHEWRFMGRLGMGGKFWINDGHWYVSCYREDETPERIELIHRTNLLLISLHLLRMEP